ncbi:MAG: hypothetical protein WDN26_24185 [Chitinophagaceae bacterium]
MGNKHQRNFVINILLGLLFTSGGILSIMFTVFSKGLENDKILWTAIPIVTINIGLIFLVSAAVHKVKADLIRKQKQKSRPE